jgi:hypothetical protein
MVVPGGCTGVCQPLDVLIMKPFKALYAKCYTAWLQSNGFVDSDGNVLKASHNDMLTNLWNAWQLVPSALVKKSFCCSGLGLPLDGTGDDAIFDYDLRQEMITMGLSDKKKVANRPVATSSAPTTESAAMDIDVEDEEVVPPVEQVESDHEEAANATAHLTARLARSVALGLRPRR